MSCGEDGTVRLFDLRKISRQVFIPAKIVIHPLNRPAKYYFLNCRCQKVCCKDNILILCPSAITAMCASPISSNYIAVGSSDSHIRIYDRRYLSLIDFNGPNSSTTNNNTVPVKTFTIPSYEKRPFRVTSIKYSSDESELLVSYSSDHLYLFDVTKEGINVKNPDESSKRTRAKIDSPPTVRRLRLRGDWSDTGPQARPEREAQRVMVGQARPQLQATIMHRMTEVLSRMLADPRTRIGLSAHGNEIADHRDFANSVNQFQSIAEQGISFTFVVNI